MLNSTFNNIIVYIFFILLMLMGSFFVVSLILAVVNDSFVKNEKSLREKQKKEKELKQFQADLVSVQDSVENSHQEMLQQRRLQGNLSPTFTGNAPGQQQKNQFFQFGHVETKDSRIKHSRGGSNENLLSPHLTPMNPRNLFRVDELPDLRDNAAGQQRPSQLQSE